jgi:CHASE2 domain-containing sensor protein
VTTTAPEGPAASPGLWRVFFEHWVSGMLLGLAFTVGLVVLAAITPLQQLERIGNDTATAVVAWRAGSRIDPTTQPAMLFITIDDPSLDSWGTSPGAETRRRIANTIRSVQAARPRLILLDLEFSDTALLDEEIRSVLSAGGAPMVLVAPVQTSIGQDRRRTSRLEPGNAYPDPLPANLRFGASQVVQDTDGVVRSLRPFRCFETTTRTWRAVPSLAHQAVALLRPEMAPAIPPNCEGRDGLEEPIIFLLRPESGVATAPPYPWFRTVSAADVARLAKQMPELLRDAVVVIGQDNRGTISDRLATPVGEMPGALLHANAVAGLLYLGRASKAGAVMKYALKFCLITVAALVGALYWVSREAVFAWFGRSPDQSLLALLLDLLLFAAFTCIAFGAVAWITIEVGAEAMLAGGIGLGTLVPAFAVIFESLVEIGRLLMVWLHHSAVVLIRWAERLTGFFLKRTRPPQAVCILLLLAAAAAFATQPSLAQPPPQQPMPTALLRQGNGTLEMVEVQRRGALKPERGEMLLYLYTGDTVRILDRPTMAKVIYVNAATQEEEVRFGREHVVRNVPPSTEDWEILRTFRELFRRLRRDPLPPQEPPAHSLAAIVPGSPPGRAASASSASACMPDFLALLACTTGGGYAARQAELARAAEALVAETQEGNRDRRIPQPAEPAAAGPRPVVFRARLAERKPDIVRWELGPDIELADPAGLARSMATGYSAMMPAQPTEDQARQAAALALSVTSGQAASVMIVALRRDRATVHRPFVTGLDRAGAIGICSLALNGDCEVLVPLNPARPTTARASFALAGGVVEATSLLVADAHAVPLAWTGGTGPYAVVVQDGSQAILRAAVVEAFGQATIDPNFLPNGTERLVTITDMGTNAVLRLKLMGVASTAFPAPLGGRSITPAFRLPAAAWLYVQGPEWRLEAMRRMAALAAEGDVEARAMLNAILSE